MRARRRTTAVVLVVGALLATAANALPSTGPPPLGQLGQSASVRPAILRDVGFDQKIGGQVPLDLVFRDEADRPVALRQFFGQRPVVLALVYYECPMLCTLVLNGAVSGLKPLQLEPGKDFEFVAVSFNPREGALLAAAKKANYLDRYGRAATAGGWHFLTGSPEAIAKLTAAVGFRYAWDKEAGQYAHPTGILVLTPDGKISRYLFGIEYEPRDLKLALVESSAGKLGTVTDQVLLYCFHYDPANGRYSTAILGLVRAGGVVTLLALGLFLTAAWRRERRAERRARRGDAS